MILTLDIETWKSKRFAFGVILNPESMEHKVFYSPNKMKDYILGLVDKRKRAEKIKILGHNIAYDLNWLFDNYEMYFKSEFTKEKYVSKDGTENIRKRYYKKIISREGKFYQAKLYNLEFLDTFNIFCMGLDKAGYVVGNKKELDIRKKFENNEYGKITQKDIDYCINDCLITYQIYEYIKNWVESHGGKLKLTIASNSISILKAYNPNIQKYLTELNKNYSLSNLDEFFRDSYYGGRTETHLKTGADLNYYDINSLYPYVMAENYFPNPLTLFEYKDSIYKALREYEGCAEIEIFVPDDIKIPVLPVRTKNIDGVNDGKIIYPKGQFWGKYCFPEIRLALEMGCHIINTGKIVCGKRIKSPFKEFVNVLYNERLEKQKNKDKSEYVTKINLNAGYGKFGQRDFENRIISIDEADNIFNDNKLYEIVYYKNEPYVKYSTKPTRSRTDILCFASYVTSYARCKIYKWYEKAEFDIYYSDTDSLITSKELPTGKKLGELKLEAKILEASFKGRKDYYLRIWDNENKCEKGIVKRKGCSLKMVTELHINDSIIYVDETIKNGLINENPEITKLYHIADNLKIEKILKSRESLIRNLNAGHLFETEKSRIQQYDNGRIWTADEISIPYTIYQESKNSPMKIRTENY